MEKPPQKIESQDKRVVWDSKLKELEKVTDRLGMPIDGNILETIAGLNLLEIPTTSSCGGHLRSEEDHKIGFPYFGGHATNEPKTRFVGEQELRDKVAVKYGIDPKNVDRDKKSLHEYWDILADDDYQETEEYQAWMSQNEDIKNRIARLLEEFYQGAEVLPQVKLHIGRIYPGYRIETVYDSVIEALEKSGLSEEEMATKAEDYVRTAQEEMIRFTEFLKRKYLSDNSNIKNMPIQNTQKNDSESLENEDESKSFDLYAKDFGIDIGSLKNKSVLDAGCGSDASFVKYCLRHDINIVGLDINEPDLIDKELLKDHYVRGDLHAIPFSPDSFDLVIMRAVPADYPEAFRNIIPLLKSGGEFKISPLFLDDNDSVNTEITELLNSLNSDQFEVSKEVRDNQKTEDGRSYARYLVTIKRKL